MKTDIETVTDPEIAADEWIRGAEAVNVHTASNRFGGLDLERMKAEFIANGGKVQQIPRGASGQVHSEFNNVVVKLNSIFSLEEHEAHVKPRVNRRIKADHDMVDKIRELLPIADMKKDLSEACQCSDDKVQRILRIYFTDDENAQKFMRQSSDHEPWRTSTKTKSKSAAKTYGGVQIIKETEEGTLKLCAACKEWMPHSIEYYSYVASMNTFRSACRACRSKAERARRNQAAE